MMNTQIVLLHIRKIIFHSKKVLGKFVLLPYNSRGDRQFYKSIAIITIFVEMLEII